MKNNPTRLIKSFEKSFCCCIDGNSTLWLTDQKRCYSLAFTWYNAFPDLMKIDRAMIMYTNKGYHPKNWALILFKVWKLKIEYYVLQFPRYI